MAYDEDLAQRVGTMLAGQAGLVEKKMFGGVGFMIRGNMACGVHKERLIVRVGAEAHDAAMTLPHTHPFDITGKAMTGWVMVAPEGCRDDEELEAWVKRGVAFALTLPAK